MHEELYRPVTERDVKAITTLCEACGSSMGVCFVGCPSTLKRSECGCVALLDEERIEVWREVFPEGRVPITSPVAYPAELDGEDDSVFEVALGRMPRGKVVQHARVMARLRDADLSEVLVEYAKKGTVIRAKGCGLVICPVHVRLIL